MPILDTISNFVVGLSPRRRHRNHRDTANPPPPSHDSSEQNERTQTSGVRDTPILPSGVSGTGNSPEGPNRSSQVRNLPYYLGMPSPDEDATDVVSDTS